MKAIDPLQNLKDTAIANITPYLPQVGRKAVNEVSILIKNSATAKEVQGYYSAWQQKLSFNRIANLPDLHKKPATRNPPA